MFETLSDKFEQTIRNLRGIGKITDRNIEDALREVRLALLEADVHFQVVKDFIEQVRVKALGQEVLRSLTPEQHFIKIVNEELRHLMGDGAVEVDLAAAPPVVMMVVGLQGSGKTTSVAKLAQYFRKHGKRSPYLVPADVYRPAAIQQLQTLGQQIDVPVHPSDAGADPVALCREAVEVARNRAHDLVLIDTAGRLHIDDELMAELERIKAAVNPHQILLVVDAMVGQDAVNVANGFHGRLGIGGVMLTKLDGDARGGAALSVRAVTGRPILFSGTGEKVDAIEVFHPERMASRILGMGDVLTLIERAQEAYDRDEAVRMQQKLRRNEFTLEDFRDQLQMVKKMGSMGDLMAMIPGMKKLTKGVDMAEAETELKRVEAIINSMTKQERHDHTILNGSRRKRIASGSGTSVAEVNRFLKQYQDAKKVMKRISKLGGRGMPTGLPF
jgi:signal recognition particle subunit SRP54